MGTAINHHVPDRVKPSFVIFDIRALRPWRSARDAQPWASDFSRHCLYCSEFNYPFTGRRYLYSREFL